MSLLLLKFETYEEPLTLVPRVEVKAVDTETGVPVASLPRHEMQKWLAEQGYRWRPGSSGLWERAA